MAIKHRSAKTKGYKFQKDIAKLILEKFNKLKPEEVVSTPSSINGEDLLLSDNARQTLSNVSFELKRQESLSIWKSLEQNELEAERLNSNPILIFKRNRSKTYATVQVEFLLELLYNNMKYKEMLEMNKIDVDKLKEIFNDDFLNTLLK